MVQVLRTSTSMYVYFHILLNQILTSCFVIHYIFVYTCICDFLEKKVNYQTNSSNIDARLAYLITFHVFHCKIEPDSKPRITGIRSDE